MYSVHLEVLGFISVHFQLSFLTHLLCFSVSRCFGRCHAPDSLYFKHWGRCTHSVERWLSPPLCDLAHEALCRRGGGGDSAYFINVNFKALNSPLSEFMWRRSRAPPQLPSFFSAASAVWLPADPLPNISSKLTKHWKRRQVKHWFSTSCAGDWQRRQEYTHPLLK